MSDDAAEMCLPLKNMHLDDLTTAYADLIDAISRMHHQEVHLAHHPPRRLLVLTKPGDPRLVSLTRELAIWLLKYNVDVTIWVNGYLQSMKAFRTPALVRKYGSRLNFWKDTDVDADFAPFVSSGQGQDEASSSMETAVPRACDIPEIDLIITLGGDGTVLHASLRFQQSKCPPIFPFHLGSLGFLTVFDYERRRNTLLQVLDGHPVNVNIRMRICCQVYRAKKKSHPVPDDANAATHAQDPSVLAHQHHHSHHEKMEEIAAEGDNDDSGSGSETDEGTTSESESDTNVLNESNYSKLRSLGHIHMARFRESSPRPSDTHGGEDEDGDDADASVFDVRHRKRTSSILSSLSIGSLEDLLENFHKNLEEDTEWHLESEWQVMNDMVVDRGSAASMCQVELFADDNHLTTILADGLVIATSTGSTAYSVRFLHYKNLDFV